MHDMEEYIQYDSIYVGSKPGKAKQYLVKNIPLVANLGRK